MEAEGSGKKYRAVSAIDHGLTHDVASHGQAQPAMQRVSPTIRGFCESPRRQQVPIGRVVPITGAAWVVGPVAPCQEVVFGAAQDRTGPAQGSREDLGLIEMDGKKHRQSLTFRMRNSAIAVIRDPAVGLDEAGLEMSPFGPRAGFRQARGEGWWLPDGGRGGGLVRSCEGPRVPSALRRAEDDAGCCRPQCAARRKPSFAMVGSGRFGRVVGGGPHWNVSG